MVLQQNLHLMLPGFNFEYCSSVLLCNEEIDSKVILDLKAWLLVKLGCKCRLLVVNMHHIKLRYPAPSFFIRPQHSRCAVFVVMQ